MPLPLQTVQTSIIYPAARISGIVLSAQRGMAASDMVDMLQCLNTLIDEWATQRLLVYRVKRAVQQIVSNQADYTIGPGAPDWDMPFRPLRIELADLIQVLPDGGPPVELPLAILTPQDWFSIAVKSITGSTPQKLYYEPDVPLGIVHLWPVPQVANQISLGIWDQLRQFATLDEKVSLPQGYLKALQYNLAKELSMRPWHSGKPSGMSQLALEEAATSLAWVKSMNRPTMDFTMRCEGAAQGYDVKGRWDITTNQWRWQ